MIQDKLSPKYGMRFTTRNPNVYRPLSHPCPLISIHIPIDIQPRILLTHKTAVFLHFVGAAIHFVAGTEANFCMAVINVVHSRY